MQTDQPRPWATNGRLKRRSLIETTRVKNLNPRGATVSGGFSFAYSKMCSRFRFLGDSDENNRATQTATAGVENGA